MSCVTTDSHSVTHTHTHTHTHTASEVLVLNGTGSVQNL
jgi:hypothetical protein